MTFLLGVGSSFIGSFLAFVLWVHFHLDDLWEARKQRVAERRYRRSRARSEEASKHPSQFGSRRVPPRSP